MCLLTPSSVSVAAENEEGVGNSAFGTGTTLPLCEWVVCSCILCVGVCINCNSHHNTLIFGPFWTGDCVTL